MALTARALIDAYLATLASASAATQRQRRWALAELFAHATKGNPSPTPAQLLAPETVSAWLLRAASGSPGHAPASVAGLRARASAVRALAGHATAHGLLPQSSLASLERATTLPTAPPATPRGGDAVGRLLTVAAGPRPYGVDSGVWSRFGAHVHLLAATGAPERDLARLRLGDVDLTAGTTTVAERTVHLDVRAVATLATWLADRASVVATLQGSDPGRLWVRVRPAGDRHTAHLHPAGLPISERGLRLAFQQTRDILAVHHPDLADVEIRAVRRHRGAREPVLEPAPAVAVAAARH